MVTAYQGVLVIQKSILLFSTFAMFSTRGLSELFWFIRVFALSEFIENTPKTHLLTPDPYSSKNSPIYLPSIDENRPQKVLSQKRVRWL